MIEVDQAIEVLDFWFDGLDMMVLKADGELMRYTNAVPTAVTVDGVRHVFTDDEEDE